MSYLLRFSPQATEDIKLHKKSGNKLILKKISSLLKELTESPFEGTGNPEPLKYDLQGKWSRRITKEHRLVYEVFEDYVAVLSAYGHYL